MSPLGPDDVPRLDLQQLGTFVAVVDCGGFGRAADRLGVSQPTVSHRVARLERELGTRLLEAPRRRVILTDDGDRLLAFCARFLPELDALMTSITRGEVAPRPIRIACPGAFGRYVVFPALAHPALEGHPVRLLFRTLDAIYELVTAGAVDVGIAYDVRVTSALDFRRIATEEFCLVTAAGDEPSADASLEEIARRTFVTYEECDYVFGKWFGSVYGAGPSRLDAAYSFSRLEEVVASVIAGRGCTIAPLHTVRESVDAGRLSVFRPARRPRCFNPEYAVTRPGWRARPEVEALLEVLSR